MRFMFRIIMMLIYSFVQFLQFYTGLQFQFYPQHCSFYHGIKMFLFNYSFHLVNHVQALVLGQQKSR